MESVIERGDGDVYIHRDGNVGLSCETGTGE